MQFEAADSIGDRFLSMLQSLGVQPPVGGNLEDELLSLTQLVEVMKNPSIAAGSDQVDILRSAAALHDLAAKILTVEPLPDFSTFVPHLSLIAATRVRAASLAQNAASGPDDDTARKFAELYIGSLAVHVATDVVLDSPTNAKGDNPDVMFTLQDGDTAHAPQRWALAIKTISSRQGQTIFERIKEGAEQIDDPKCTADRGMVIINAKSALNHDALWAAAFPDLPSAIDALDGQLQELIDRSAKDRPQPEWDDLFLGKVVRPVLFLGQSLVRLPTVAGARTPTPLKMLKAYGASGTVDPVGVGLAALMNEFMQTILLGIPGDLVQGRFPR
ncbi:hypothetical protein [Variovorax sp. LT1R16]|uniref:hypothetical protein n=1 Tax=Variovorax sp. LT1R16 TaxID=3443728 RepID=UPI003F4992DF